MYTSKRKKRHFFRVVNCLQERIGRPIPPRCQKAGSSNPGVIEIGEFPQVVMHLDSSPSRKMVETSTERDGTSEIALYAQFITREKWRKSTRINDRQDWRYPYIRKDERPVRTSTSPLKQTLQKQGFPFPQ